jgi:hypothetical protein
MRGCVNKRNFGCVSAVMSLRDTREAMKRACALSLGRGWLAAGAFSSRREPGEGVLAELFGAGPDFRRAATIPPSPLIPLSCAGERDREAVGEDLYGTTEVVP